MDEKSKKARLMKDKLFNWCVKLLNKYDKIQAINGNKTNYYE